MPLGAEATGIANIAMDGTTLDTWYPSPRLITDASLIDALTTGTTQVSISVGGNDAGFADVLTECAMPGWASDCNGAIDDADTFWWWEDPEYHHGMTPEEVQEWEDNFDDYESAPSEEDWEEDPEAAQEQYDRYFEQPVEVDAREEGAEFVEGMTPEELERLLEASK